MKLKHMHLKVGCMFVIETITAYQYSREFCISFGSDQLSGPEAVAVNVNNQLLVAEHCFTLDGQAVSKFGIEGSNQGPLIVLPQMRMATY